MSHFIRQRVVENTTTGSYAFKNVGDIHYHFQIGAGLGQYRQTNSLLPINYWNNTLSLTKPNVFIPERVLTRNDQIVVQLTNNWLYTFLERPSINKWLLEMEYQCQTIDNHAVFFGSHFE